MPCVGSGRLRWHSGRMSIGLLRLRLRAKWQLPRLLLAGRKRTSEQHRPRSLPCTRVQPRGAQFTAHLCIKYQSTMLVHACVERACWWLLRSQVGGHVCRQPEEDKRKAEMVEIIDQWRVVVKEKDEELGRLQQQNNHLQTQVHS